MNKEELIKEVNKFLHKHNDKEFEMMDYNYRIIDNKLYFLGKQTDVIIEDNLNFWSIETLKLLLLTLTLL